MLQEFFTTELHGIDLNDRYGEKKEKKKKEQKKDARML